MPIDGPICKTWANDAFKAKIIGSCMSFLIISINYMIRIILISLIRWIGEDTHSKQIKSVTIGVFIAQFFNTAILLLLVSANVGEVGFPFAKIFSGPFYDFTP